MPVVDDRESLRVAIVPAQPLEDCPENMLDNTTVDEVTHVEG